MSIEERAEEYCKSVELENDVVPQWIDIERAYIAGETEQQALSEADLHKYKSLYEELDANQEPLQDRCILAEARIKELEEALEGFVNSCYTGCTKHELNRLRIKAENTLNNQQQ